MALSAGKRRTGMKVGGKHLFQWIMIVVVVIVVVGLASYIFLIYRAASSLEITDGYVESMEETGTMYEYEADVVVLIINPTSTTIEVEKLTYSIYLEEDFVGSGQRDGFSVKPGKTNYSFPVIFSLMDANDVAVNMFMQGNATLHISGMATVLMIFGLHWGSTTVPYDVEDQVGVGGSDPPAPVFLALPTRELLSTSVRLDWTQSISTNFSRYEVHMSEETDFTPSSGTNIQSITNINERTTTVADLDIRGTYYFKIRFVDVFDQYADSNEQRYSHRLLSDDSFSTEPGLAQLNLWTVSNPTLNY